MPTPASQRRDSPAGERALGCGRPWQRCDPDSSPGGRVTARVGRPCDSPLPGNRLPSSPSGRRPALAALAGGRAAGRGGPPARPARAPRPEAAARRCHLAVLSSPCSALRPCARRASWSCACSPASLVPSTHQTQWPPSGVHTVASRRAQPRAGTLVCPRRGRSSALLSLAFSPHLLVCAARSLSGCLFLFAVRT